MVIKIGIVLFLILIIRDLILSVQEKRLVTFFLVGVPLYAGLTYFFYHVYTNIEKDGVTTYLLNLLTT